MQITITDDLTVTGRGRIFIISLEKNGIKQKRGKFLNMPEEIEYDGDRYRVRGWEFKREFDRINDKVGLQVTKINENEHETTR